MNLGQVTLIHWGGGSKVCTDAELTPNGKRIAVLFAYGHWLEFLVINGKQPSRLKESAKDDGPGKLSTWRLSAADLARAQEMAAKIPKKKRGAAA